MRAEVQQLVRGGAEDRAPQRALPGGADDDHGARRTASADLRAGPGRAWRSTSSTAASTPTACGPLERVTGGRSGPSRSARRGALRTPHPARPAERRRRPGSAARRSALRPRSRRPSATSAPGRLVIPQHHCHRLSLPSRRGRPQRRLTPCTTSGSATPGPLLPEPASWVRQKSMSTTPGEEDADADHQRRSDAEPGLAAVGVGRVGHVADREHQQPDEQRRADEGADADEQQVLRRSRAGAGGRRSRRRPR